MRKYRKICTCVYPDRIKPCVCVHGYLLIYAIHIQLRSERVHTHTNTYIHICLCVRVCVCVYPGVGVAGAKRVQLPLQMHSPMYAWMHILVHMYMM